MDQDRREQRYIVYFNTHRYHDCSDTPRATHRIIKAQNAEEARDKMCEIRATSGMAGSRYIGMIHHAELAQ
jgi:hypothetical protein